MPSAFKRKSDPHSINTTGRPAASVTIWRAPESSGGGRKVVSSEPSELSRAIPGRSTPLTRENQPLIKILFPAVTAHPCAAPSASIVGPKVLSLEPSAFNRITRYGPDWSNCEKYPLTRILPSGWTSVAYRFPLPTSASKVRSTTTGTSSSRI